MREPIVARRLEVPVRTGSAPQGQLDLVRSGKGSPPARPVKALSHLGTDGGSGSGPRPWDTLPQGADTHPADKPRTRNRPQPSLLPPSWLSSPGCPGPAPDRPRTPRRTPGTALRGRVGGAAVLRAARELIAQ